jgi:hypothetical protein
MNSKRCSNIIDELDGVVKKVGGTVVNSVDNAGRTVEKLAKQFKNWWKY